MDIYERVVVLITIVLLMVIVFTPMMIISPNTTEIVSSYGFFFSYAYLKSFVLMVGALTLIILWSFNKAVKVFIVEKLGFQGNKYLITALLLGIVLANFVGIGESISLLSEYTTVIKLTTLYYIVQIVLVLELALCVFLIFSDQHQKFRGHVVGYHGKRSLDHHEKEGSTLFDGVYHDE